MRTDDRGSQSLEMAMSIPLLLLVLSLLITLIHAGLAVLTTHQLAATAARHAAVADDARAHELADRAAAQLDLSPTPTARRVGDLVTATVERHLTLAGPFPVRVDLTATATNRIEDTP